MAGPSFHTVPSKPEGLNLLQAAPMIPTNRSPKPYRSVAGCGNTHMGFFSGFETKGKIAEARAKMLEPGA